MSLFSHFDYSSPQVTLNGMVPTNLAWASTNVVDIISGSTDVPNIESVGENIFLITGITCKNNSINILSYIVFYQEPSKAIHSTSYFTVSDGVVTESCSIENIRIRGDVM